MHPSRLQITWLAIRPRTLSISLAPVLLGSSLAWAQGATPQWLLFLTTLVCAILIQIATNLHNDAIDCEKGNDQADRSGPIRVTAAGWVSAQRMRHYANICFGMAFVLGSYLALHGGWPIIAIGLASLLAGWGYSGGPRPISYTPFGELFVLVFFGILAVWGCVWLQGQTPDWDSVLVGMICGSPAAAVLLVNNTRDLHADLRVGRRTLASVLGPMRASYLYSGLLATPFILLAALAWRGYPLSLIGFLAFPFAWKNGRCFWLAITQPHPATNLNPLLPATAKCGLILSLLLTVSFGLKCLG